MVLAGIIRIDMDGTIRKVIVGDIKSGMVFLVGQVFNGFLRVEEIVVDYDFARETGVYTVTVNVCNEREEDGVTEVWKRFPLSTCNLEYDLE